MIKIYCIECLETGEKYIGSTKQKYLSERIADHRYRPTCRSSTIIKRDNYKYYLLEEVEESQRLIREQYYMDITDKCINYQRAYGFNRKEHNKEYSKKYYQLNKDKKKEYQKEYDKYRYSWGGDPRVSNNLLLIDTALFASK